LAEFAEGDEVGGFGACLEVVGFDEFFFCYVEEGILVDCVGWAFTFQFEDHDTVIVAYKRELAVFLYQVLVRERAALVLEEGMGTCCEKVDCGMCSNDPETIVFATETLNCGPFIRIPDSNRLVLAHTQNQFLTLMKQSRRSIIKMSSASIHLPGLRFGHSPNLDETIVACGDEERVDRMEGDPIDASVVAFEDVFYGCVCVAEDVACLGVVVLHASLEHLFFEGGDCVLWGGMFLAKSGNVPYPAINGIPQGRLPDGLIK
jgi:hypothetical protein